MLSLAPPVLESKQERSLKSLFPLKRRLERLYLFTEVVCFPVWKPSAAVLAGSEEEPGLLGAATLLFPPRCRELRWEEKHPWEARAGAVGWPGGLCRETGQPCLSWLGPLPGALLCALWSCRSW